MVTDALKVGVLIQHGVVRVQEKVEGVLVQEVHLESYKNNLLFYLVHIRQHSKKNSGYVILSCDLLKRWSV